MEKKSKVVTSLQTGVHEKLSEIITKTQLNLFKKPFSNHSIENFEKIIQFIDSFKEKNIILDLCCGIGESSFYLAEKFSKDLVIGIDKSKSRVERNNDFKKSLPNNLLLIQGDIIDLIRMIAQDNDILKKILKVFILYPNPYPKKSQLQKRWHGHSLFYYLMMINSEFELRSNWKIYLEEFEAAAKQFNPDRETLLEEFVPEKMITPFERKYFFSEQTLYKLILK